MNRQKTKLGARILSEGEMSLILPNWKKIEEQIEVFRNNIEDREEQTFVQKTNNIGIIGCRGAGKTSVLRTFRHKLSENPNNIVLPIVVPEDMSTSNSLMDVILGMFKQFVDGKRVSKQQGECIYRGRNSLELSYNEMVKQYCYIKKDYRNILIQQFTTEQYYLDKTKEVFNSDTVFIEKFNQFINDLVELKQDSSEKERTMIFLFIDDIDLSTTRCVEVAKALLSYLSNQRIVTFISGDMDTFEEALTLDFLRQEKALDSTVFHETYFNVSEGNGDLLERKRVLSYEYLKKIIPPAYRYLIKYWSLEDRGNYQIEEEGRKLGDLLCDIVGKKVGAEYFSYQEDGERKYLPYTFCMFDETSRGLNNVYNVLSGLSDVGTTDETEKEKSEFPEKMFLETIIASKILYARHKEQLLKQIIVFEEKKVTINFDNANNFIYKKNVENMPLFSATERFEFFVLIDFAARIFSPHSLSEENYVNLKIAIEEDFINYEEIEGKIPASIKRNIQITTTKEKVQQSGSRKILGEFFKKGDFLLNLYLIKYLGRDTIHEIGWSKDLSGDYTYSIVYALSEAISSMKPEESMQKEYMAELYLILSEQINELLSKISLNPSVIFGDTVLKNLAAPENVLGYTGANYKNTADTYFCLVQNCIQEIKRLNNVFWANYYHKKSRFWIYYKWELKKGINTIDLEKLARNLVHNGIIKSEMRLMENELTNYSVDKLSPEEYAEILLKEDSKEEQAILAIDQKGLWENSFVRTTIRKYLQWEIEYRAKCISSNRILFDMSSILSPQGVYFQFKHREASRTGKALVDELDKKLDKILFFGKPYNDAGETANAKYISLEHLMVIQCMLKNFLNEHPKAKYGKQEIKRLLMESGEIPILLNEKGNENIWEQIQKKVIDREDDFLDGSMKEIKDILDENQKDEIYNRYYSQNNNKALEEIIKDVADNNMLDIEMDLTKYIIQERKIKSYLNDQNITWEASKEAVYGNELKFYLHSYLRYLQANDKNIEGIGKRAEAVAQFAQLLLEGESLADKKEQGEIFEILSKAIGVTEEEFEKLF